MEKLTNMKLLFCVYISLDNASQKIKKRCYTRFGSLCSKLLYWVGQKFRSVNNKLLLNKWSNFLINRVFLDIHVAKLFKSRCRKLLHGHWHCQCPLPPDSMYMMTLTHNVIFHKVDFTSNFIEIKLRKIKITILY